MEPESRFELVAVDSSCSCELPHGASASWWTLGAEVRRVDGIRLALEPRISGGWTAISVWVRDLVRRETAEDLEDLGGMVNH